MLRDMGVLVSIYNTRTIQDENKMLEMVSNLVKGAEEQLAKIQPVAAGVLGSSVKDLKVGLISPSGVITSASLPDLTGAQAATVLRAPSGHSVRAIPSTSITAAERAMRAMRVMVLGANKATVLMLLLARVSEPGRRDPCSITAAPASKLGVVPQAPKLPQLLVALAKGQPYSQSTVPSTEALRSAVSTLFVSEASMEGAATNAQPAGPESLADQLVKILEGLSQAELPGTEPADVSPIAGQRATRKQLKRGRQHAQDELAGSAAAVQQQIEEAHDMQD